MAVTTVSLFKRQTQAEPEDEFIATLRARYENEINSLIRFGELKARTREALRDLESEKIRAVSSDVVPTMVEMSYIVDHLRGMGVTDDRRVLESVIGSLVEDGSICREGYSGRAQ